METRDLTTSVIVVGVDQSVGAEAALRFGLDEARLRQATLRAVYAWEYGYWSASGFEGASPPVGGGLEDVRRAAEASLDAALAEAIPDVQGAKIERRAVQGRAAEVLVHESLHADLLVVGSRGHGGFTGLLLGSVSQQCAHHAHCPVVIVRTPHGESRPST